MVNQDIVNYLTEGRKRGFSIQLLRSKLLEGGFQAPDVDEAIAFYEHQQMPPRATLQPETSSPKPLSGIQQKPEVYVDQKKEFRKTDSNGEGKWIKIAGILGILLIIIHLAGIILSFAQPTMLSDMMNSNGLTLLIVSVILVLMGSLYYYSFHKIGDKTDERFLNLGAWFTIVPIVMYIILAIVASVYVAPQTMNFFSSGGGLGEDSYKITFLVISILWVVALLLNLIGQIMLAIGMIKTGKAIRFFNIAGILNLFVFLGGLSFLIGMVILIYSILNAFSVGTSMSSFDQVLASNGVVAMYSFMVLFGVKLIARIFEAIGLFDASKKFE